MAVMPTFEIKADTAAAKNMLTALNDLFDACKAFDVPAETKAALSRVGLELAELAMARIKVSVQEQQAVKPSDFMFTISVDDGSGAVELTIPGPVADVTLALSAGHAAMLAQSLRGALGEDGDAVTR